MNYYLVYLGQDGQLFGDLLTQPAVGRLCVRINVHAENDYGEILYTQLPAGANLPPCDLWPGALKKVFPGAKSFTSGRKGDLRIPLESLIRCFDGRPTSLAAVEQMVKVSGMVIPRLTAMVRELPIGVPDLDLLVPAWIDARDKKRERALHRAVREGRSFIRPTCNRDWDFLDLMVLAHWDRFLGVSRHELWIAKMVGVVGDFDSEEAKLLGSDSSRNKYGRPRNAMVLYLSGRGYCHFRRGRPSDAIYEDTTGGSYGGGGDAKAALTRAAK